MNTLKIVPLAMPSSITQAAYNTIKSAALTGIKIFLQTENHPASRFIIDEGIHYISMDDLYEQTDSYDELNSSIAKRLMCNEDAVYAVCGRGVSEPLMACIRGEAEKSNVNIITLPSSGYAEAAAAMCSFNLSGAVICAANSIPNNINVYNPLCIEEIDNAITAGNVKIALSEFYPEGSDIIFAYSDTEGTYHIRNIKLFELDRQKEYFATTSVLIRAYTFLELERYGTDGVEEITRLLRGPGGCPWDIKQTHMSLKNALIEEAYEVLDAIECEDEYALCEELGDLFLQVVFHAQIETEKAAFTMRDVCTELVKKLIFRHPHVFANATGINTSEDVLKAWDELKKQEKNQSTQSEALMAVPRHFPALMRSAKVQKRAADVGFDWKCAEDAMYKIDEEKSEVLQAVKSDNADDIFDEVGDLLFSVVNVARLLKVNPELALTAATDKFQHRFNVMENLILKDKKNFTNMSLSEMDNYWEISKTVISKEKI